MAHSCPSSFHLGTDVISAVVREVPEIPIIGNGGITSREDADAMTKQTGCAAVMAAGGLLVNLHMFTPGSPRLSDPFDQCNL